MGNGGGETDGRTEVHANSTFDEMRAREIKVELGRRGADLGAVEEVAAARRPGRTVESRRTDGRTDGRTLLPHIFPPFREME